MSKIKKNKNFKGKPSLVYLAFLSILALLLLGFSLSLIKGKLYPAKNVEYDKRADKSEEAEKSAIESQIAGQLEEAAQKGSIHVRIYSEATFPNGSGQPGDTVIQNPPSGGGSIRVEISLNDTKETVFKSGMLKEGESLYKIRLNRRLKRGTYDATAQIYVYDEDGEMETGGFSTGMKLIIQ